jgi:N utilization substance protein B
MTDEQSQPGEQSADEREEEAQLRNPRPWVLAFEALYEGDIRRHDALEVLPRLSSEQWAQADRVAAAERLVRGVRDERELLDSVLANLAPARPLAQMSAVDRNILRLGLLGVHRAAGDAETRTAINEALELARRYGGDSSTRFVRGVLGRAAEIRNPPASPGGQTPPGQAPRTL